MESRKAFEIVEKEMDALSNKEYAQLNSVIELTQEHGRNEFSKLYSFLITTYIDYSKEKTKIYKT